MMATDQRAETRQEYYECDRCTYWCGAEFGQRQKSCPITPCKGILVPERRWMDKVCDGDRTARSG